MIPYQQITAMVCGTVMQIVVLTNFYSATDITNTSYSTRTAPPEEIILILLIVSTILIIYGLIPWHLFRRTKPQ